MSSRAAPLVVAVFTQVAGDAPASTPTTTTFDDAHVSVGAPDDAGVAVVVDGGTPDDDLPDTVPVPLPTTPTKTTATTTTTKTTATTTAKGITTTNVTTAPRVVSRGPAARQARISKAAVDQALAKAQRLYVSGRYADALGVLVPVERQAPNDARVHRMLGLYNAKLRRIDEARLHLLRYLELSPDAADAERVRAQIDRL